jgi:hypothetical protein
MEENLNAVVIVSEENKFVINCINYQRTIHENSFFERVFGKEDLAVLLSELKKEGFSSCWIIINPNIKGDEMLAIYRLIEKFKLHMTMNIELGPENYLESSHETCLKL